MKKSYLRTSLALACALGLGACGGSDDEQLQLVVNLFGVTKTGMTISNGGAAAVPVGPGAVFLFPALVPLDSDYDIKIVTRPPNTDSCEVFNGKGNTGSFTPNNIVIQCIVTTYTLGGTVSGLVGGNLVVNNGAQKVTIPAGATTFTMTTPTTANPKLGQVAEDTPYGLTILEQPAGLNCVIGEPNGVMPAAAVTNIAIKCTPKAAV